MEGKKKVGRPKQREVRNNQVNIRLTDDEIGKLLYIQADTGQQFSEIFRDSMNETYNKLRYRNGDFV